MSYQLNITFDPIGLEEVTSAGYSVVITKTATGPGGPTVAWIAFQPMQWTNVSWDDSFSVYASTSQTQPGTTLIVSSQQNAQLGMIYTFGSNMIFSTAPGGPANVATIINGSGNPMTTGLQQSVSVNGSPVSAPVNAAALPPQAREGFAPSNVVTIFVAAVSGNGTVLPQIPGNALSLTLSSQNPVANVVFNDQTGSFIQQ